MGVGPGAGSRGWITARPPMDFPSRVRILLGSVAIVFALLASMALLNLLVLEPGATSEPGTGGGDGGQVFQPGTPDPGTEPAQGNSTTGTTQEPSGDNPCKPARSITRAASITTLSFALTLWILAVWWRQARQTRVMNGWAIAALVFTLLAVTLFFAWYIVHKICSLDVLDLDTCRELARNLMVMFIAFLVPAVGFIAFAVQRKTQGHAFLGLWAGAGFIFLYLSIMAMGGWLIADDICDRYFEPPDVDDFDPDAPDGGGQDPGQDTGTGTSQPTQAGQPPPGQNGGGGGDTGGGGGNPGGPRLVGVPQVSPVALLIVMGVAAVIVIGVLAFRGGGARLSGGMVAAEPIIIEDRGQLLAMLDRRDLRSSDRVVAAYRAFLAWCSVRGVPKVLHETPREHALRAVQELKLPVKDTMELAEAYSQTRLGDRDPPADLRRRAISYSRRMGRER